MRIEGKDLGVKVSVVCPGYIKTAIFENCKLIKIDREKMLADLPERFGITPEQCADAILNGVRRNKAIIVVTGLAKFLWLIHRISPNRSVECAVIELEMDFHPSELRRVEHEANLLLHRLGRALFAFDQFAFAQVGEPFVRAGLRPDDGDGRFGLSPDHPGR